MLRFNRTTKYEEYTLSYNPVDILSSDNVFLECDIAQGMVYERQRSGIIQNWTKPVDPGYEYVESFTGVINTWYMMELKGYNFMYLFQNKK